MANCVSSTILIFGLLVGIARDVLVVTNAYNGMLTGLPEELEYAALDACLTFVIISCWSSTTPFCLASSVVIPLLHAQWYVHPPFRDWPDYWPAEKSLTDARHRTEFYMTHAFCFAMRCVSIDGVTRRLGYSKSDRLNPPPSPVS